MADELKTENPTLRPETTYISPDPDAPAGLNPRGYDPNSEGRPGERFLSLSREELEAQGVRVWKDEYTVKMSNPANEPNISKPANRSVPL